MKKFIVIIVCIFACFNAVAHSVAYNTNSHIYHNHLCEWAHKCTKNCITIDSSKAKQLGGRPCKVCGG